MKFVRKVWDLYYEGFRDMTLGRTLWAIILVKLFIMFFVLKPFFFPNYIKEHARGDAAEFVAKSIFTENAEKTEKVSFTESTEKTEDTERKEGNMKY